MTGIDNTAGDLPKEASGAASEQFRAATQVPMTEEQMRAGLDGEQWPVAGQGHQPAGCECARAGGRPRGEQGAKRYLHRSQGLA